MRLAVEEIDPDSVYSFNINELEGFDKLWNAVQELSTIPADFNPAEFGLHRSQPLVREQLLTVDALPSDAIKSFESSQEHYEQAMKNMPQPVSNLFLPFAATVRLGEQTTPGSEARLRLERLVSSCLGEGIEMRGNFLYPPGGFRGWHTNQYDELGWRMYIINTDRDSESDFRYVDRNSGELKILPDFKGQVNFFKISKSRPIWHCITSRTAYRWSKGFLLPDDWHTRLYLKDSYSSHEKQAMSVSPHGGRKQVDEKDARIARLQQQVNALKADNQALLTTIRLLSQRD